jgi:hypothetical protein
MPTTIARPASLLRLRPMHALTFARVLWWMAVARVLLAGPGFGTARRVMRLSAVEPVERPRASFAPVGARAERILAVALKSLDLPVLRHATCLPRAIVLERVARAAGVDADLVIGVDTSEGFRAHAWLEVQGYPVGASEAGAASWQPLGRFSRTVQR